MWLSLRPDPANARRYTGLSVVQVLVMATLLLVSCLTSAQSFQQGFDFRNTAGFVNDPPGDSYVLPTTAYPTKVNGVTFGWAKIAPISGRDRSTSVDPRLAGINFVSNGAPGTFYVDLPAAGTYNLSLAMGDAGWMQCWVQCQVQFLDGSIVLATLNWGALNLGYFCDAMGNVWSAAAWPSNNLSQQVTLTGTRLTMVIGTNKATGDATPVAFLGISQISPPNFSISASPTSLSVQQGNQGTSTITATIGGGFNNPISLSASGAPSGTTVSFNPNPIPAPGAGSSTMTISVGASTPVGTYPITVTGNGGGLQQYTTVTLTVTGISGWQQGFDFRNTAGFVNDPPGDTYVLATTAYPTRGNGVTFGWVNTAPVQARDRSKSVDPRLAGVNFVNNGSPATFNVDLPSSGTYSLALAMGDAGYQSCWVQCQIQFLDGSTVLATVTGGSIGAGYFYDAKGNMWSAASWPSSDLSQQVTLAGTRLTVVVGTSKASGDSTPIAFLGLTQVSGGSPNYTLSASPASLSVQQGNQGTSTITTSISGGFNSSIALSAAGVPSGTTVSFNPNPIPAPGNGSSTMTITVGSSTPVGTYPITVTGNGGGIQQNTTVTLTVTAAANFTISASPASLSVQQGNQGTSTITTAISGGFNSSIALSASGMPSGTTVSFNPNPIPAPGSGASTMTITVGANTPVGTYPITVTGNGGGIQQNTTVTLTVTAAANFTISASPSSLSVQQGNQGTSTITTTISGGFNSSIALSASGAPSGTTVSFNPNPIPAPGSGSSTMTITVGASTPVGTYPITVTGNGGGIQQNTTVTLTVTAAANFTISASPASLSVQQGNQGTSTITTTISGGFNNSIALSASGAPSGTTVSFNPNPIPAPGSGSSTMTITVGASTPVGTYPITVTGNGGGIQQNATVTLTVVASSSWAVGFDFRSSAGFVGDPPGDTDALASTAYPTTFNGINFGWANVSLIQSRDRNNQIDPRLAGMNFAYNGSPGLFYVDLPASGTYNLSLALGDAGYQSCSVGCQIQFLDGSTILSTLTKTGNGSAYFYDAQGNNWSAAKWPANNLSLEVAIAGTRLTMVLGSNQQNGDYTPVAFLGVSEVTLAPNFLMFASPTSVSVQQGNQGTTTISTSIAGGFNSPITLSASGVPSGTTVSFNPNPISAPGAGSSTMTVNVGSTTPTGTYPITVAGNGGGVQQTLTVTLTVTPTDFILTADPPNVTVAQGSAGNTTVRTTLQGAFNSAITLSTSGVPSGSTVSFNPNPIPAPGGGTSAMTITVGANTPLGTYPITVTGKGGGLQHNFTVTLVVISSVWQQGFDFRGTLNFVTDPPGATGIVGNTTYPTQGGLTTYGWLYTATVTSLNRNSSTDPRLAGINYVTNGTPAPFYVDLPAPGTYSISLAMGDDGYPACGVQCYIQFLDGDTVLATVTGGPANQGYFYDAQGNLWSAAQWPASNVSRQVTLSGTQLTVQVGNTKYTGDYTSVAYVGVTQVSAGPTFALQGPTSISVGQGQYSTADVFTILVGGFNSAINLSATGGPAGTAVTFNPSTIPAPGAGTSVMTISVPNNAPLGNYPVAVTAKGGGIIQNVTVMLTVTVATQPSFTLGVPATVSGKAGGQATGIVSTAVSDGFNSAVTLTATGGPSGTTVTFNPGTIPAPGSGNSSMTVNIPAGAAFGSYPIVVNATSGQGNQSGTVVLTASASGNVNLPSGTGWVSLGNQLSFCDVSPGFNYYNPDVGEVDAFDFLGNCIGGQLVAYGGGTADTANERYFLWTSGHNNYQGNEMYVLNLQGDTPAVARVTDPGWSVLNTDVPPDCACKGTNNCGQGLWHDGAGHPVSSPYSESGYSGATFESIPAPDGSHGQPSCGYGKRFTPNARENYAGMAYHAATNKLFTWGGVPAADPTGFMFSNWVLDVSQNPAVWTRLKDSSYAWITAATYDYTSGHSTSGSDLVFDENKSLYAYNSSTDTYTKLATALPYIGYNVNLELDPIHHYLVMEDGDNVGGGYHLRILNIDSCNGTTCSEANLDKTASCTGALGYWVGMAWDSKRSVMAIFPSSTNCTGAGCTAPFNTAYLLNPDPNNPVTITYQGQQQTIQPQQCFAASYGPTPPMSFGPGVYSRFKYYPNEDVYLYIPDPSGLWILRLEP